MKMLRKRLMSTRRTQSQDRSICPWSSAIRWILCKIEWDARLTLKISITVTKPLRNIRPKELDWWSMQVTRLTKNKRVALRRVINSRLLSCLRTMRRCFRSRALKKSLRFWASTLESLLSGWRSHVRVTPRDSRNNSKSWCGMAVSSATTSGRWKTFWRSWTSPVRNARIRT